MKARRFPRYLDAPVLVLWFEADTFAVGMTGFLLSIALHWSLFPAGVAIAFLFAKAKKELPRGFLKQIGYYMGIHKIKGYPGFFENEFSE